MSGPPWRPRQPTRLLRDLAGQRAEQSIHNAPPLPNASSWCGACQEACPVGIHIPGMLRRDLVREGNWYGTKTVIPSWPPRSRVAGGQAVTAALRVERKGSASCHADRGGRGGHRSAPARPARQLEAPPRFSTLCGEVVPPVGAGAPARIGAKINLAPLPLQKGGKLSVIGAAPRRWRQRDSPPGRP
jgi:ferredoxin